MMSPPPFHLHHGSRVLIVDVRETEDGVRFVLTTRTEELELSEHELEWLSQVSAPAALIAARKAKVAADVSKVVSTDVSTEAAL